MLLKEIKPLHFAFYKKKPLNTEIMSELYSEDELICDVNVLKTISKYSNGLFISRKCRDLVLVYNEKSCIKFKPNRRTCYDIKKIYKKFVDCNYLDCLIMNVEGLFYSMSRINQWKYSVSLYLSLDDNYKDFLVEDVFDNPSILVGDVEYVDSEYNTMFNLKDLEEFNESFNESFNEDLIETASIDVTNTENKTRVINFYEKERSLIEKFVYLFIREEDKPIKKHTIRYGKKEGDRIYCHTKPMELLEFNKSNTISFLINLISKLRTSPMDFIEIDCGVLIWLVRNSKGLFLFSNFEVDEKVSHFLKDFHNIFLKIKEKNDKREVDKREK